MKSLPNAITPGRIFVLFLYMVTWITSIVVTDGILYGDTPTWVFKLSVGLLIGAIVSLIILGDNLWR